MKYLTGVLKVWVFKINLHCECVSNAEIDGHQCTILWNSGDLKISHINTKVFDGIIKKLNQIYGNEAPLAIIRGGGGP